MATPLKRKVKKHETRDIEIAAVIQRIDSMVITVITTQ